MGSQRLPQSLLTSPGKRSRTGHRGVGYAEKGDRPATEETQNHPELKISVMWGTGKGEDSNTVCALACEQARRPEEEQGLEEGDDIGWGHTALEMSLKHSSGDALGAVASTDVESRTEVGAGGGDVGVSRTGTGTQERAVTGTDKKTGSGERR